MIRRPSSQHCGSSGAFSDVLEGQQDDVRPAVLATDVTIVHNFMSNICLDVLAYQNAIITMGRIEYMKVGHGSNRVTLGVKFIENRFTCSFLIGCGITLYNFVMCTDLGIFLTLLQI